MTGIPKKQITRIPKSYETINFATKLHLADVTAASVAALPSKVTENGWKVSYRTSEPEKQTSASFSGRQNAMAKRYKATGTNMLQARTTKPVSEQIENYLKWSAARKLRELCAACPVGKRCKCR